MLKKTFPLFIILLFFSNTLSAQEKQYSDQKRIDQNIDCITQAIYHETRAYKKEAANVFSLIANRVDSDKNFPNDFCKVVQQKLNGVPQFSWYGKKLPIREPSRMKMAQKQAKEFYLLYLQGKWKDTTNGATMMMSGKKCHANTVQTLQSKYHCFSKLK